MHCNNGDCKRPIYRGTECFKCWAGTKWDSMKQRVENRRGNYPQWQGKSLEFTRREFVAWALANPPPPEMERPSVDRIDAERGYLFGNIRWLEFSQNCRNQQHDVPAGLKRCPRCGETKPLTLEFFGVNRAKRNGAGFQEYFHPCRRAYSRDWEAKRRRRTLVHETG